MSQDLGGWERVVPEKDRKMEDLKRDSKTGPEMNRT